MKSILIYIVYGFYMISTIFKEIKFIFLKKFISKDIAEVYLNKCVFKWAKLTINLTGTKVKVIGSQNIPQNCTCLFVANHQSAFDIPLILGFIDKPMGIIAKKELKNIPIISYWMKQIHCIFMDRLNIRDSIKSINEGIEILKSGHSLAIFPEGTRGNGKVLGEFKKGSIKLGIKSNVAIIPVAIFGTRKIWENNNNTIRSAEVSITICSPIYANDLPKEEQNNLAEKIKLIIEKQLEK
jgi:1-acyl-sn-glycerol-3-phosphate acyltransferase